MYKFAVIAGNFCLSFLVIIRANRQKLGKGIKDLNNTINQIDLTDMCRALLPMILE